MATKGPKVSAGILVWKAADDELRVLLAHPGGPLFRNKDRGAWTIPKGEVEPGEDLLDAARREFSEETGFPVEGPFVELGVVRLKSGKCVHAWAAAGDCDPAQMEGDLFEMKWPPRSGRRQRFPEIDRVEFFTVDEARQRINPAQIPLIDELQRLWAGREMAG